MAITYFGHALESYQTSQTTETTTLPASTADDDFAISILFLNEDVNTLNALLDVAINESYTEILNDYHGGVAGEELQLSLASKQLVGSDANPQWSWSGNHDIKGGMAVYRGATSYTVQDIQVARGGGGVGQHPESPAVTFTAAGLFITIVINWDGTGITFHASVTGRSTTSAIHIGDAAVGGAGTVGPFQHTIGAATPFIVASIALQEGGAAPNKRRYSLTTLGVG
jgi:hypothetical protein